MVEYHVLSCGRAQHDHDVNRGGQVLEDGAHRSDPDAGRDEQDLVAAARMCRDRAVGTFDGHPCADRDVRHGLGEVAERLDSHAEERRPRQCGYRVGMGLPPQVAVEKAPLQELPADDRQSFEVTSRADH